MRQGIAIHTFTCISTFRPTYIRAIIFSSPQALTPPMPLYPPNAGPVLPGLLSSSALGNFSNVAAVAAVASAAAQQAANIIPDISLLPMTQLSDSQIIYASASAAVTAPTGPGANKSLDEIQAKLQASYGVVAMMPHTQASLIQLVHVSRRKNFSVMQDTCWVRGCEARLVWHVFMHASRSKRVHICTYVKLYVVSTQ